MLSNLGRRVVALLFLPALLAMSANVAAQTKPARTEVGADSGSSILWVGNSFFYYNNSMHGHYNDLVRSGEPEAKNRSTSLTISGSGLDWHDLAAYLAPDGIGKYSFVPGNKIVFNPPGRQFDTVVMMDCSQCPVHPQLAPRVPRHGEEERRDPREVRRPPGALHVVGLQGRAGDDGAARRAVHARRQRQRCPGDPRRPGLRQGGSPAGPSWSSTSPTSAIRRSPAPTSPPAPATRRCAGSRRSATSTPPGSTRKWRPSCRRWRRTRSASTTAARACQRKGSPACCSARMRACTYAPCGTCRRSAMRQSTCRSCALSTPSA